jgi:hypothetical protein
VRKSLLEASFPPLPRLSRVTRQGSRTTGLEVLAAVKRVSGIGTSPGIGLPYQLSLRSRNWHGNSLDQDILVDPSLSNYAVNVVVVSQGHTQWLEHDGSKALASGIPISSSIPHSRAPSKKQHAKLRFTAECLGLQDKICSGRNGNRRFPIPEVQASMVNSNYT